MSDDVAHGLFGPGIFGTGIDLSALDDDTALRLGLFMGEQMRASATQVAELTAERDRLRTQLAEENEQRLTAQVHAEEVGAERDAVIAGLADALGMEDGADHWSQLTAQAAAIKASEEEASDELERQRPVIEAYDRVREDILTLAQHCKTYADGDAYLASTRVLHRLAPLAAVDALGSAAPTEEEVRNAE